MTFVARQIAVQFILDPSNGTFADSGLNTLTLSNLRVSSRIIKAGGPQMGQANVTIFGMTESQMKKLTRMGQAVSSNPRNTLIVMAGDAVSGMSTVFSGDIFEAYADLNNQPDVAFRVTATSGGKPAMTGIVPTSFKGSVDVATVMQQLATQSGLQFENNGVSVILKNPYLSGDVRNQMLRAVKAAGIDWTIDNGTLAITKRNQGRTSQGVVAINSSTGMITSPMITVQGLKLKAIFNPAVKFLGIIEVTSEFIPKSQWRVNSIEYDLDAQLPGGQWAMSLECSNPGSPVPVSTS